MYWKHKLHIYFFCVLIASGSVQSQTLVQRIKELFSFSISTDVFNAVNKNIVGKMQAKSITVVLPNRVEIEELEILDEHGKRVLYGKKAALTVSLLSLITKNIRVTNAFVEAPFFRYTVINGVHNVIRTFESPHPQKAPSEKSSIRVTIEAVRVENGAYEMYHDAGVEIYAHNIKAKGGFWVEPGPFGVDITEATIASGQILTGGMDLPLDGIVAKTLWISDKRVSVKNLIARYEQADLTGSGTVFIEADRYDVNATIDAPPGTYPRGLPPLPFEAPALKGSIVMTGKLSDPHIAANVNFKSTDFNGLLIKHGKATAQINRNRITVEKAFLRAGEQGEIEGSGTVDIDKGSYSFDTTQKRIRAPELAKFLSFEEKTDGILAAKSKIFGSFASADQNVHVVADGTLLSGRVNEINLAKETNFDVDINLVLKKHITIHEAIVSDKRGLNLNLAGFGNLVNKSADIRFNLACGDVNAYVSRLKNERISGLSAHGTAFITGSSVVLHAPVAIEEANVAGIHARNVQTNFDLSNQRISFADVIATINEGTLQGSLVIDDPKHQQNLSGNVAMTGVQIKESLKRFVKFPVDGIVHATATINGTLSNPLIQGTFEGEDLVVDQIKVRNAQLEGSFERHRLAMNRITLFPETGSVEGINVFYDANTNEIGGALGVSDIDLSSVLATYFPHIDGELTGPVHVEGTMQKPLIVAPLVVSDLTLHGIKLGNGPLTLGLGYRPLLGRSNLEDLVFSASANVVGNASSTKLQLSIALNKMTTNADITFENIELSTTALGIENNIFGVTGRIDGTITAEGPLSSPLINANMTAREYGFFDPRLRREAISVKKVFGPAEISLQAYRGALDASACVSLTEPSGAKCPEDAAIRFTVSGPFTYDSYNLAVNGVLEKARFEDVLFVMKNELMTLQTDAKIRGKLVKPHNKDFTYSASIDVQSINGSLPNIPNIVLQHPTTVLISPRAVELDGDATLNFSPGTLTVNGSYSPSDLDLHVSGTIPLMLSRLFVPLVQRAEGLARGNIALTGSPSQPIIEGMIEPQQGAFIILRKWLEPIEVRGGTVSFTKTSLSSFKTKFSQFKLAVGDGKLTLDGAYEKRYILEALDAPSMFNLKMQGSNIVIRDRLNFVETDFEIEAKQNKAGVTTAAGRLVVTDGNAHRQFDLRNFVAQAETGGSGGLKLFEATPMNLNLDIVVRQFRASARMLNLDIESNLRGQMTLTGSIASPKFKGSLFVSDGAIHFPYKSFDLVENQIELNETSAKPFDPKINIVATQELETKDFPQISEDTTVQLSLRGDLDRLSLELQPIRGNRRLSQLKIFMLLMSPRFVSDEREGDDQLDSLRRGAQNAAMALSGEVFLRPLTNELAELLERKTKTRIQFGSAIEPGGLSLRILWKLGPRIELQGSYLFLSEEARRRNEDRPSLFRESYPLGDLKLKLLLADHRPFGPLTLESSVGLVRQIDGDEEVRAKARFKYEVLSK